MEYYSLTPSLDNSVIGLYPQIQEAIYHCDIWENSEFIDNVTFQKTNLDPIVANAIIAKGAKLTDLLSGGISGFSLKLLMSGKLKTIIQRFRQRGLQFYNAPVSFDNRFIDDYWVINPFEFNMEFIDYTNSNIFLMKDMFYIDRKLDIMSYDDYLIAKNELETKKDVYTINIEHLILKDNLSEDFFVLENIEGIVKYYVSERLKNEIENANCTGIEFMPSYLDLNQWLSKGNEREKIYGKV